MQIILADVPEEVWDSDPTWQLQESWLAKFAGVVPRNALGLLKRKVFCGGTAMQMVKVQIPDKKDSAKALVEMSGRGRVLCFADDVYIVSEPALALLDKLGVHYQELGRGGFDYAEKALRDASAAQV